MIVINGCFQQKKNFIEPKIFKFIIHSIVLVVVADDDGLFINLWNILEMIHYHHQQQSHHTTIIPLWIFILWNFLMLLYSIYQAKTLVCFFFDYFWIFLKIIAQNHHRCFCFFFKKNPYFN